MPRETRSGRQFNDLEVERPRGRRRRARNNPNAAEVPRNRNPAEIIDLVGEVNHRRNGGDLVEELQVVFHNNIVPHEAEELEAPAVTSPLRTERQVLRNPEMQEEEQQQREQQQEEEHEQQQQPADQQASGEDTATNESLAQQEEEEGDDEKEEENPSKKRKTVQAKTEDIDTVEPFSYQPELEPLPRLLQLDLPSSRSDTVLQALQELSQFIGQDSKLQEQAFSLGGHAMLLFAMRKHSNSVEIQEQAALCLSFLVWNRPGASIAVDQLGGLEWLLEVSRFYLHHEDHHDNEAIQFAACCAIGGMLPRSPSGSQRLVLQRDGVGWILNLMKEFAKHVRMQVIGCQILYHMLVGCGINAKNRMNDKECHAPTIVAEATREHADDVDLAKDARTFMLKFYEEDEDEEEEEAETTTSSMEDAKVPASI